jgi:hypothetical protein
MALMVSRDALDKVSAAMYSAIRHCRDLEGVAVDCPAISEDSLSFAVLGAMTMLCRDEVLIDEMMVVPRQWPRCNQRECS